ncbi:hypothetical protein SeLEV6574_g06233 [Synchytrium endobioticum]|uniref:Uncharacterized protein n=1 Tax=Synchytrium endobioticum TaxID=286115 RepID=A0A507CPU4_9FUNG|nr:hypothetical protein SeLEV6574_g06233 [Synchytrium endobioticum]
MEDGVRIVHRWQENAAIKAKSGAELQPASRPNSDGATSDGRVVVLTEEGIDFFSTTPYVPPRPAPATVNLVEPWTRPVYFPSRHKTLQPSFPRNERAGVWRSAIAFNKPDVVQAADAHVRHMLDCEIMKSNRWVLRYRVPVAGLRRRNKEMDCNVKREAQGRAKSGFSDDLKEAAIAAINMPAIKDHLHTEKPLSGLPLDSAESASLIPSATEQPKVLLSALNGSRSDIAFNNSPDASETSVRLPQPKSVSFAVDIETDQASMDDDEEEEKGCEGDDDDEEDENENASVHVDNGVIVYDDDQDLPRPAFSKATSSPTQSDNKLPSQRLSISEPSEMAKSSSFLSRLPADTDDDEEYFERRRLARAARENEESSLAMLPKQDEEVPVPNVEQQTSSRLVSRLTATSKQDDEQEDVDTVLLVKSKPKAAATDVPETKPISNSPKFVFPKHEEQVKPKPFASRDGLPVETARTGIPSASPSKAPSEPIKAPTITAGSLASNDAPKRFVFPKVEEDHKPKWVHSRSSNTSVHPASVEDKPSSVSSQPSIPFATSTPPAQTPKKGTNYETKASGGALDYEFLIRLRQDKLRAKGVVPSIADLDPDEVDDSAKKIFAKTMISGSAQRDSDPPCKSTLKAERESVSNQPPITVAMSTPPALTPKNTDSPPHDLTRRDDPASTRVPPDDDGGGPTPVVVAAASTPTVQPVDAPVSRFLNAFDVQRLQQEAAIPATVPAVAPDPPSDQTPSKKPPASAAPSTNTRSDDDDDDDKPTKKAFTLFKKPSTAAIPHPLHTSSAAAAYKSAPCVLRICDFQLHCDDGRGKPLKHFFPLDLRTVLASRARGADVVVHACTRRKGRGGTKLKKMAFAFAAAPDAQAWADELMRLVYDDSYAQATQTTVVVLTDKFDKGDAHKTVLKYMKPVWDVVDKPVDVRAVQFNEFSVVNVLGALDWTRVSNVVCVNTDFTPRLAQVLVRNQWSSGPLNLPCEADPVDAALAILKSMIGSSKKGIVHLTSLHPKRDENKLGAILKHAFKK